MNLVADVLSGLSAMGVAMIVGFIFVIAIMTIIGKKL